MTTQTSLPEVPTPDMVPKIGDCSEQSREVEEEMNRIHFDAKNSVLYVGNDSQLVMVSDPTQCREELPIWGFPNSVVEMYAKALTGVEHTEIQKLNCYKLGIKCPACHPITSKLLFWFPS